MILHCLVITAVTILCLIGAFAILSAIWGAALELYLTIRHDAEDRKNYTRMAKSRARKHPT